MNPDMQTALATAIRQWHEATRHYETVARAFADAETQRQLAERDLHELARAIEVSTGSAPIGELVTNAPTPLGTVTTPVVSAPAATADGVDAAQIVLDEMMKMRMGNVLP